MDRASGGRGAVVVQRESIRSAAGFAGAAGASHVAVAIGGFGGAAHQRISAVCPEDAKTSAISKCFQTCFCCPQWADREYE